MYCMYCMPCTRAMYCMYCMYGTLRYITQYILFAPASALVDFLRMPGFKVAAHALGWHGRGWLVFFMLLQAASKVRSC